MNPKDSTEQTHDLKNVGNKGAQLGPPKEKKVLEIGLQAAHQMKTFSSQTYYNRMVNASCQYNSEDFIEAVKQQTNSGKPGSLQTKLERFIEKVSYRIESALSSNEIINVFQDDFMMLGDEEAAVSAQNSTASLTDAPRRYSDQTYVKDMSVSCIKFSPHNPHWVAFSLVKNMDFASRVEIMGTSFDAHLLILDFSDSQMIQLAYDLVSPVEITTFEFHPDNERVVMGGCLNGQVITWDLYANDLRVGANRVNHNENQEGEEATQQIGTVMKCLAVSQLEKSHRSYVSDLKFIPACVRVDKKNDNHGKSEHFLTVSEDGWMSIWDCKAVDKKKVEENEAGGKRREWQPFKSIQLFRPDGSPDLGLSKILFESESYYKSAEKLTTFWASSFEGELMQIDWDVKPIKDAHDDGNENSKKVDNVIKYYDNEMNFRPILSIERSPFYDDLVMTVHDFNFCIWKTSTYKDNLAPIFRSANTFGAHNTCGAFSPTRPGVIFITKTNAIDIWDFYDQSNKPSITLPLATSQITYFRFQKVAGIKGKKKGTQNLAYGEFETGNLNLCEVPHNLSKEQDGELKVIKDFWEREY